MTTEILSNSQEFFLTTKTGTYITTNNGEYILVKGGSVVAHISEFVFTEQDMGEATITCDVKYPAEVGPNFSLDWCITYKGEKFFLSTLQPPCIKDNKSIFYKYSLTFRSERDDLKRYDMLDIVKSEEGDDIANKYSFVFDADINAFADRFNANLAYNFGSRWKMVLADGLKTDRTTISCVNGVKLWDLLQKLYELYGVRWRIAHKEKTPTTDEQMVIHVGDDPIEINHVFEYDPDKDDNGVTGGLCSIERVNPLDPIYTRMRGIGGEKNLPYRYFKDKSKVEAESKYPADPDYNPALSTSVFNNLMPKCFREYWKGYNGTLPAIDSYAYKQGVADKASGKPNPVDYAVSDKEYKWGVRYGALQPNEDIFPTIQGVWDPELGRIDEIVAVSDVETDSSPEFDNVPTPDAVFEELATTYIEFAALETNVANFNSVSDANSRYDVQAGESVKYRITATWMNEANISVDDHGAALAPVTATEATLFGLYADGSAFRKTISLNVKNPRSFEFKFENLPALSSAYVIVRYSAKKTTGEWTKDPQYNYWQARLTLYDGTTSKENNVPVHTPPSVDPDKLGSRGFYIWIKDIGFDIRDPKYWALNQGDMTVMFSDGLLAGSDYEFIVAAEKTDNVYSKIYVSEDTSKSITTVNEQGESITVSSKWRIGLVRSDVELKASGNLIPNTIINAKPGDHFFLTNIQLPQKYVEWAESRLQNYVEAELSKVDDENPTFAINPDNIFCANFAEAESIRTGARLRIHNKRLIGAGDLAVYITSMTLTYSPGNILPKWDIVVSETPSVAKDSISLLQSSVERLSRSILPSSEIIKLATLELDRLFLRSDGLADTSYSPTTFESLVRMKSALMSENFMQGTVAGSGWGFYKDKDGSSVLEVDKVNVRRELHANKATVNQLEFLTGITILSRGGIKVTKVEVVADGFKLFFDTENGTKLNPFVAGDLAYAVNFNNKGFSPTKYYWALVKEVGDGYIVLSASDKSGAGVPAVGDNVVQFGNRTDTKRQSAFLIDQTNGGEITQLAQLGDANAEGGVWALQNRAFVGFGYDDTTGQGKLYVYGNAYIGDRDIDDPESTYITFQKRAGDARRKLHIKGDVELGKGSSGLNNMTEFVDVQNKVNGLDYLHQIFPDQILDNAGASLAKLIAVKDGSDNIVAGMYGGGVESLNNSGYKDPTHGTLLIFAGATDVQNAATAKTRIYEDGFFTSINGYFDGEIKSTKGNIGGYAISSSGLRSSTDSGSMTLSTSFLSFRRDTQDNYLTRINNAAFFGANVLPATMAGDANAIMRIEAVHENVSPSIAPLSNMGIMISASGAAADDTDTFWGNHALYITKGDICGFRMKVRRVNQSQKLSVMDSIILVLGDCTITLPTTDVEDGQIYYIRKSNVLPAYNVEVENFPTYAITKGTTDRIQRIRTSVAVTDVFIFDKVNKRYLKSYLNSD